MFTMSVSLDFKNVVKIVEHSQKHKNPALILSTQ